MPCAYTRKGQQRIGPTRVPPPAPAAGLFLDERAAPIEVGEVPERDDGDVGEAARAGSSACRGVAGRGLSAMLGGILVRWERAMGGRVMRQPFVVVCRHTTTTHDSALGPS